MLKTGSYMNDNTKPLPKTEANSKTYVEKLLDIVSKLRSPQGCPWDREQTHRSLTQYAIEETFELVEAIEANPLSQNYETDLKSELGDVLFQVVLHSQLAAERGAFDFSQVVATLSEKLIRRHPHVFANTQVQNTAEVIKNWEVIKQAEKQNQLTATKKYFDIPAGLPALQRSYKIGKKTEKLKFDWANADQVWLKVQEEQGELAEAIASKDLHALEHEIGDVLFSLAQLCRHLHLEPEQVLRKANQRFENRFEAMSTLIAQDNKDLTKINDNDKEAYWQKAKKITKHQE